MVASDDGKKTPRTFAVDERLIMPETRYEVIDGEVVYVSPADYPHAGRHSKLSGLLEAHAAEGYDAASDMLTRTSEKGDMAPDGSVFPEGPDPETGGRRLEELAFEIASTETLAHAGRKAAALSGRGVRRVFAIDVERRRLLEWSQATGTWQILQTDGVIEDVAFVVPLPIAALVGAASEDDAMAKALIAKRTPAIVALEADVRAQAREEGREEGRAQALVAVVVGRGLAPGPDVVARIQRCRDRALLDSWWSRALTARSIEELLDD